jgi:hypothetical protein
MVAVRAKTKTNWSKDRCTQQLVSELKPKPIGVKIGVHNNWSQLELKPKPIGVKVGMCTQQLVAVKLKNQLE